MLDPNNLLDFFSIESFKEQLSARLTPNCKPDPPNNLSHLNFKGVETMQESKSAPLFEKATRDQSVIPAEILDACSLAMDQALGMEKTSLTAISQLNAQAMEFAWLFAPVFCDFFGLAVRAVANSIQWTRFALMLPPEQAESTPLRLAAPAGVVVNGIEEATQRTADALALGMDTVLGNESTMEDLDIEVLHLGPVLDLTEKQAPLAKPAESSMEPEEESELEIASVA